MAVTLYGIKNCDTIKKARKWLEAHAIEYRFHDFRVDGLEPDLLDQWCQELGWELVLNKRGTTWRQLPDDTKNSVDETSAKRLMLESPAMIKRPVLDTGSERKVGFKEADYTSLFSHQVS
jgi:Spx/MgsR family transcriptional regulator